MAIQVVQTSISRRNSGSDTTLTLTGVVPGNVLIAFGYDGLPVLSSGYTSINTVYAYKVATSSTESYTFYNLNNGVYAPVYLAEVSGVSTTNPVVDNIYTSDSSSATSISLTDWATTDVGIVSMAFFAGQNTVNGTIPPAGTLSTYTLKGTYTFTQTANSVRYEVFSKELTVGTHDATYTTSGTNNVLGETLLLRPQRYSQNQLGNVSIVAIPPPSDAASSSYGGGWGTFGFGAIFGGEIANSGAVTVDQNQIGNVRISKTNDTTQIGNVRITTTVDNTQVGNVRITATTDRAQAGNVRIQTQVLQDQIGNVRVQLTNDKAQLGNVNIRASVDRDQLGNIRIGLPPVDWPQVGNVNIRATTDRAQLGNVRITRTNDVAQIGNVRISRTIDTNQIGNVRILATVDRAQLGNVAILANAERPQIGNVRIATTNDRTQVGNVRIVTQVLQAQIGNVRITTANDKDQTGNVRVIIVSNQDQIGNVRVSIPRFNDQVGNVRIVKGIDIGTTPNGNMQVDILYAETESLRPGVSTVKDEQYWRMSSEKPSASVNDDKPIIR